MAAILEDVLISVWRQAMVEEAKSVTLENKSFPVAIVIGLRAQNPPRAIAEVGRQS